jgi:CRISPR-associated protein Cas1
MPIRIIRWPQVSSGRPGSIAAIRKNQAVFARAAAGFTWVGEQLAEKISGQRALLAQFAEDPRAPAGFDADVRLADRVLSSLEKEFRKPVAAAGFNPEASAGLFRGREGTASRLYFNQLAKILAGRFGNVINVINVIGVINVINSNDVNDPNDPNDVNDVNDSNDPNDPNDSNDPNDPINFTSRQKRPAYDPFNVLLNYLYGMLYTAVHLSLLKSGLDPYMGILHADRYGATPTLVFGRHRTVPPLGRRGGAPAGVGRRSRARVV